MQPEPLVALADDDVLISIRMLAEVARLLVSELHGHDGQRTARQSGDASEDLHLYVGRMEWYSWHDRTLVSSGWSGTGLAKAVRLAQETWRNCSPTGAGWTWTGWAFQDASADAAVATDASRDSCVGPLAFAKGPLTIVSRAAARWLVEQPSFVRDVAVSEAMTSPTWREGVREHPSLLTEPGSRAVLEDVQIGYWLVRDPQLRVVQLPSDMWADGLRQVRVGLIACSIPTACSIPHLPFSCVPLGIRWAIWRGSWWFTSHRGGMWPG